MLAGTKEGRRASNFRTLGEEGLSEVREKSHELIGCERKSLPDSVTGTRGIGLCWDFFQVDCLTPWLLAN